MENPTLKTIVNIINSDPDIKISVYTHVSEYGSFLIYNGKYENIPSEFYDRKVIGCFVEELKDKGYRKDVIKMRIYLEN